MPACLQSIDHQPGRRLLARKLKRQPSTGQVRQRQAQGGPGSFLSQIRDVLAVDIVLAHRQRLEALREALRAFAKRRHDIERQVERRFAFAIETSAR